MYNKSGFQVADKKGEREREKGTLMGRRREDTELLSPLQLLFRMKKQREKFLERERGIISF